MKTFVRLAFLSPVILCLALLLPVPAASAVNDAISIRIDGKVLRKASGKLVLSLSEFELRGSKTVRLLDPKTKKEVEVGLSVVYPESSYTEVLPDDLYASVREDEWTVFVVWAIKSDLPSLNMRLREVHEFQNQLRREIGNSLVEGGGTDGKISSRVSLNKIEKFHRVAAVIAGRIKSIAVEKNEFNPFQFDIVVQVGYNPFGTPSQAMANNPTAMVREVVYWEAYRILTQQFGVDESLVDFIFNSPPVVRLFVPLGEDGDAGFFPKAIIPAESVDGALYLMKQDFFPELREIVRTKDFRDAFVKDRPVLEDFLNKGAVAGIIGSKLILSYVKPYVKPGAKLVVVVKNADGTESELPVVVESVREVEGYSLTFDLPADALAKVKVGAAVLRE